MAGSPYASSLGRLKAHTGEFLPKDAYGPLTNATDVSEITKLLEPSSYGPAIALEAASYQGAALLEIAINRTFVRRNRLALDSTPFAGKTTVALYLRRWDLQNISLILSAKALQRPVSETEVFLVSSRDAPAGFFAGSMTLDDFRLLLQQPTLEAVAQALTPFGYGGILLPLLDAYERSHDIFPLQLALEKDYYARLHEAARFFQGDEWVVRRFIQSEIDQRNVLLLLKARDAEVPPEEVERRFLDGGSMPRTLLGELSTARTVPELVNALAERYPALPDGTPTYTVSRTLTGYEAALSRERALTELRRMRSFPLALAMTFVYLFLADLERTDLRRIIYGRLYGLSNDAIADSLVVPRL